MRLLSNKRRRLVMGALQCIPIVVFLGVLGLFGVLNDRFLQFNNFVNIVDQTVPVAILAIGMTFVLLTAGIDLAVGSTMYLSVVAFGHLLPEVAPWVAFLVAAATGVTVGCFHGVWVAWVGVPPFIATLATLFMIRGAGRAITQTQQVPIAESVSELNRLDVLGIPLGFWVLLGVLMASWTFLRRTGMGRQLYAVGEDPHAADKAGIRIRPIIVLAYMTCGLCAGIVGFISATQQGTAQPTFGEGMEFIAIAAAVLGGTSLFGGHGGVLGALFGALLIKTFQNGLNIIDADPYIYPLVTGGFIFFAVLLDSLRRRLSQHLNRRLIIPSDRQ